MVEIPSGMDKKTYEQYQSDLGEKAPKVVFEHLFDIKFEKISEKDAKSSPDYRIFDQEGNEIAFCEVKTCVDQIRAEDFTPTNLSFEDEQKMAKKKDRGYQLKLKNKNKKAVSQLANYRHLPTGVIFVSLNMTDGIDMQIMLQEQKTSYPDKPLADFYILMKVRQPIAPSNSFEVRNTISVATDSERGTVFAQKYLSTEAALRKAGVLPLRFNL